MNGTQLAKALAERLAEVLPPGFSIRSNGDSLWLDTPDGLGNSAWAGAIDQDSHNLELYTSAAWTVLSSIQDGVTVTLREIWPMLDAPGHQMALPGAKIVGDTLQCWYGSEETPTIRFAPIHIR